MEEDLKAIYSVIVYWWGFIKDKYPTGLSEDEIRKFIKDSDKQIAEMKKDDNGLAWLYCHIGITVSDFIERKGRERKGEKVEWW